MFGFSMRPRRERRGRKSSAFCSDLNRERERARKIYDGHLARARWMREHGYQDLLRAALN